MTNIICEDYLDQIIKVMNVLKENRELRKNLKIS